MRASLTATWAAKYLIHIGALFVAFVLAYELRRALPIEWWFQGDDIWASPLTVCRSMEWHSS